MTDNYTKHKDDCQMVRFPCCESAICTCGLDEAYDKFVGRKWQGGKYVSTNERTQ